MSSNIGPEAKVAYQKYLDAVSLEEKIKRLEEFLSVVPKHKKTEKVVALNKSKLSKLKRELEEKKERAKSSLKIVSPFSIKKEGIQVILVSDYNTPGVGKTSLLNYLTGAVKEKIGKFTSLPEIGIYFFEQVRFQIVDMPSIMEGASAGIGNGKEILSQIRACDLLCICVDLTRNVQKQMELILKELYEGDVRINVLPPPISIEKTGASKIQVIYLSKEAKENAEGDDLTERIKELINENGISHAIVKLYGKINLDQIVDALTPSIVYKKVILLGTKGDLPQTETAFKELTKLYSDRFPIIIGTSVEKKNFPENFGEIVLKFLNKIKIYTMNSSGKIADKPMILNENTNVKDAALKIHKSFLELFQHAIIIREGSLQKRKKVGLDYKLEDKDIIEIHTT